MFSAVILFSASLHAEMILQILGSGGPELTDKRAYLVWIDNKAKILIDFGGGAKMLILSHRMRRTLGKEKETLRAIRTNYREKIRYADDGDKYPVQ